MHDTNWAWWSSLRKRFPSLFKDKRVLELGSFYYNLEGQKCLRGLFSQCDYVGVDLQAGRFVDIVCSAKDLEFEPESFDFVLSASMLEHDATWKESIEKAVYLTKSIVAFSWGAAKNAPHCEGEGIPFLPLPAGRVISLLEDLHCKVKEFRYEAKMPWSTGLSPSGGWGEVCLLACKNEGDIDSSVCQIDPLIEEDNV